jgi:U3 small nucleolar RNA-associated protein 10
VKTTKSLTLQRVHAAIFSLLPTLPAPQNAAPIDWFSTPSSTTQTERYVALTRGLYALPAPALRKTTLAARAGDALLFLMGVAQTHTRSDVRITALRHAGAFMRASAETGGHMLWDVQVVLPAFLVALADPDGRVRLAALEALPPAGEKDLKAVYGYDAVYGAQTGMPCIPLHHFSN